ncbi:GspJ family type II secretion system protein [bacterium]|nr:GspJ family type II secretion system protein [Akkermansiaceae bacterium]MDA7898560.1 GspJ family type II secretion system protein [bacterium]MDA8876150.1 GspJ family type II secretion system protein [Akkermansiaceae bacterium]MDB4295761.1 GspJ family type II secretion system protein [Akkermansiaceae bacterium]MDB4314245.1 GspJ family type II secretion system protein [Akkermansiaceae bacterium]
MKVHSSHRKRGGRSGFTLLELVLAMVISGILIVAIMNLADATIKSTRLTVDRQTEQISQDAFFTLLKRHFESLPGDARMELSFTEGSQSKYLSDMTFQNVPTSFNWGGTPLSTEAMRITTVPLRDGQLDVELQYFDQQILDLDGELAEQGIEPIARITLLTGVSDCEWRVMRGRSKTYPVDWEDESIGMFEWDSNTLPTQVELKIRFGLNGEVIRRVFWIPKRQNPKQTTAAQSAGSSNNGQRNTVQPQPRTPQQQPTVRPPTALPQR